MKVRRTAALAIVMFAAGCGYQAGYITRTDISRVAVPVFENETFYRNIELDLTRAVISEIEKTTDYRVVGRGEADAVLEGTIEGYRTSVLFEDANDEPQEIQAVLGVRVVLRRAGSGEVLYEGKVREGESFAPPDGETETGARVALFRRAAREVVERSFEREW